MCKKNDFKYIINIMEETTTPNLTLGALILRKRRALKFLEFINQYMLDYFGDFIQFRMDLNDLFEENKDYVLEDIMPDLPTIIENYEELRNNLDENEEEFQKQWEKNLTSLNFVEYFKSIPLITDFYVVMATKYGSTPYGYSSDLVLRHKEEDLNFNERFMTLMNEIIEMTAE